MPPIDAFPMQTKEWKEPLFGCAEKGVCFEALLCQPCMFARLYGAVEGDADVMGWGVCVGLAVLGVFVGPCVCSILNFSLRDRIRLEHGIKGSLSNDVVVSLCCTPCAAAQLHTELSQEGMSPGRLCSSGVKAALTQPQLQPQPQPAYAVLDEGEVEMQPPIEPILEVT